MGKSLIVLYGHPRPNVNENVARILGQCYKIIRYEDLFIIPMCAVTNGLLYYTISSRNLHLSP
ncbi:hypothetical protein Micbo1qcDRAFT_159510 [Microdochium bolleyi]|uniref:Uncharacterized protein n=1 Tax=Microdochium bolleyi TaxID=196109 RepID=A0A136JB05_9PEZI|nr:hypothetical protein Micbo1qcDRAFT_159510 [Microdochium bolleyi]